VHSPQLHTGRFAGRLSNSKMASQSQAQTSGATPCAPGVSGAAMPGGAPTTPPPSTPGYSAAVPRCPLTTPALVDPDRLERAGPHRSVTLVTVCGPVQLDDARPSRLYSSTMDEHDVGAGPERDRGEDEDDSESDSSVGSSEGACNVNYTSPSDLRNIPSTNNCCKLSCTQNFSV